MTGDLLAMLTVVKTLILVLGGVTTVLAYRAYRATGDRGLGLLTAGFGAVTAGAALGGLLTELLGYPFHVGALVESLLVLVGFAIITASLYVEP
jgi:hypothetical protein